MENNINVAMWEKTAKDGKTFFSGVAEVDGKKYNFIAFKNIFKKDGDKSPDYRSPKEQNKDNEPAWS